MKRILIVLTVVGLLCLCGCTDAQKVELNVKFNETKERIQDREELDKLVSSIFDGIGITDYSYYKAGNYSHVFSSKYDIVYTTSKNPIVVSCEYVEVPIGKQEKGWYIEHIIDGVDEKCFYLGELDERDLDLYDYESGELIEKGKTQEEKAKEMSDFIKKMEGSESDSISSAIKSHVSSNFDKTSVDSVTVNDDLGKGSGYIALVNLTWNVKNSAETSKKVLEMYSDDLAATIAAKYSSVNEIAVFWKVPYLTNNTSKWSYSCTEGKAYSMDIVTAF